MKVTREQAALNRARIVETAAKLFREKGFDGIGVADLMKSAGLTHGGFYGHFESKEALQAEASGKATEGAPMRWQRMIDAAPDTPVSAVASRYLTPRHRDNPGDGCVLAALGADAYRAGPGVRTAMTGGILQQVGVLAAALHGGSDEERRHRAMAAYATMVGGLLMARAVDDGALSEEILAAVAAALDRQPQ